MADETTTEPTIDTTPQPEQAEAETPANHVSSLPDWAQKALKEARDEAGKSRTTAKAQAAEQAKQEMAQQIGKALGLIKDDEQADPAKLADQLTTREGQLRQNQIELAAYRAASKHGADPDALLDSRSVVDALAKLEPSADDFGSQVDAAIKAAVEHNPKLKAGQAPNKTGNELPGGSGENYKPKATTLTDAVANHYRT